MITALALFDDDDDDHNNTGALTGAPTEANDEVSIEVERWKAISLDTLVAYKDKETLMINEFAFMWAISARTSRCTTLSSSRPRAIYLTRATWSRSSH